MPRRQPLTVFEKYPSTSSYLETFSKLHQFLQTDTFTDVELSVQGKQFGAHRLILSAHSPVFEAMFTNPMLEAANGHVVIDDVKPAVFEVFLHYLYTGIEPKVDESQTAELFVCADKYSVRSLMITCEKLLSKKVTAENVIEFYLMAEAYNMPVLRKRAYQCLRLFMLDVVKTEGWNLIKDNQKRLKKIVDVMRKRLTQLSTLEFDRPRGRQQNLRLGISSVKDLVKVDRNTNSYSHPLELKFEVPTPGGTFSNTLGLCTKYGRNVPTFSLIHCYVFFNEDKNDGDRVFLSIRFRLGSPDVNYNFSLSIRTEVAMHQNSNNVMEDETTLITWNPCEYSTLESPNYIIYTEKDKALPKVGVLLFWIEFKDCSGSGPTLVKYYSFDEVKNEVEAPNPTTNTVRITSDDSSWDVPLEQLCERTRTLFDGERRNVHVADASTDTMNRLFRYMALVTSSVADVLPSRDDVDLAMLKAACRLRMDYDLILYLEHVLVWDLDPGNCLDMIEAGAELGLGFLKSGALTYFGIHSDKIIKNHPEKWDQVSPSVLREILVDLQWGVQPGKTTVLPTFLLRSTKPVHRHVPPFLSSDLFTKFI